MNLLAIVGAVIATLVAAGILGLCRAGWRWRQSHRSSSREDVFPVRLTCAQEAAFDPRSGYHEGLHFEVFNHSDKAVRIKGFGLKLQIAGRNGERSETEQARSHPPIQLPARLEPNDGFEGYLDYESVGDRLHEEGIVKELVDSTPYVEVVGFGTRSAKILTTASH